MVDEEKDREGRRDKERGGGGEMFGVSVGF